MLHHTKWRRFSAKTKPTVKDPIMMIPKPLIRIWVRVVALFLVVSVFTLLFSAQPEMNIDTTLAEMTKSSVFQSPLSEPLNEPPALTDEEIKETMVLNIPVVKECPKLEWGPPPQPQRLLEFQNVPNTDVYIRSAYYDKRLASPNITILGLATLQSGPLFCLLKYPESDVTLSVKADIEVIPEAIAPFCQWKASVITCANPKPDTDPESMAVAKSSCAAPDVQYPLEVIHPFETPNHKFGVCLQGLFGYKSDDVGYLIEHIETNRLLGAENIFIYGIYNVSKVFRSVLNYYSKEQKVTLVPWDLPMQSFNKVQLQDPNLKLPPNTDPKDKTFMRNPACVRQNAHYLANLHCMYSNINHYKYLFYMDLDEYIVPQKHDDWHGLFKHLEQQPGYEGYASLLFREAQFCAPKMKDPSASMYFYTTAYKRLAEIKESSRSPKPVIRPKRLTRVLVNTAKSTIPGFYRETVVDPSLAKKHHYKKENFCRGKTVQDKVMEKFKATLTPRFNRVANEAGVP